METFDLQREVPTWVAAVVVGLVAAAVAYVFAYGGNPATPAGLLLAAVSVGLGLFTLYLLYRFVVAVEKIADKI